MMLTKIDTKPFKDPYAVEVFHDIVEPSFRINEKYYQYTFTLKSGKTKVALILKETPTGYEVVENPLASDVTSGSNLCGVHPAAERTAEALAPGTTRKTKLTVLATPVENCSVNVPR